MPWGVESGRGEGGGGGCCRQVIWLLVDCQLFLPFQKQPCFGDKRASPGLGPSWGRGAPVKCRVAFGVGEYVWG